MNRGSIWPTGLPLPRDRTLQSLEELPVRKDSCFLTNKKVRYTVWSPVLAATGPALCCTESGPRRSRRCVLGSHAGWGRAPALGDAGEGAGRAKAPSFPLNVRKWESSMRREAVPAPHPRHLRLAARGALPGSACVMYACLTCPSRGRGVYVHLHHTHVNVPKFHRSRPFGAWFWDPLCTLPCRVLAHLRGGEEPCGAGPPWRGASRAPQERLGSGVGWEVLVMVLW